MYESQRGEIEMADELELLPQTHQKKKKSLPAERFAQNIYWMLAADLKPPKKVRNPPHNWADQKEKKKKREREKGISMGLALLRGSCEREKESTSWLTDKEISWDGGTLKPQKKGGSWTGEGKAEREPHRPPVPPPRTPQAETLGVGLGAET